MVFQYRSTKPRLIRVGLVFLNPSTKINFTYGSSRSFVVQDMVYCVLPVFTLYLLCALIILLRFSVKLHLILT